MPRTALEALPQISPPRQQRSRETMDRVLAAFTALLAEKPFERITMVEIAALASASLPSIYARFEDKNAILLAVHEQFKVAAEARIAQAFAATAASDAPAEALLSTCAVALCQNYCRHAPLVRAALLSNSPVIYERAAQLMRRYSELLGGFMASRLPDVRPARVEAEADFATRSAFAILQQALAFQDVTPARFALSEAEMGARLGLLFSDAFRRAAGPPANDPGRP